MSTSLSFTGLAKNAMVRALALPWLARALVRTSARRRAVVMLHRFTQPSMAHAGDSVESLAVMLRDLRRAGVRTVTLEEAIAEAAREDRAVRTPCVAFTVDDGYQDFADTGFPVFEAFGCPVTCFVVPSVVDGDRWFWWDQIDLITRRSKGVNIASLSTVIGTSRDARLTWTTEGERKSQAGRLVELLKLVPTASRERFIEQCAQETGTDFAAESRAPYEVMSWDTMRALEKRGARFGAHTMTHPILSQCEAERARWEVEESLRRLHTELQHPCRVFCYPNGTNADFGQREIDVLTGTGFATAAVSTTPARVNPGPADDAWHWRVPRFAFDGRRGAMFRLLLV